MAATGRELVRDDAATPMAVAAAASSTSPSAPVIMGAGSGSPHHPSRTAWMAIGSMIATRVPKAASHFAPTSQPGRALLTSSTSSVPVRTSSATVRMHSAGATASMTKPASGTSGWSTAWSRARSVSRNSIPTVTLTRALAT